MSERSLTVEDLEGSVATKCRHHWVIESPQGATSRGVCKRCGTQREFYNAPPDAMWESDGGANLSTGRWGKARPLSAEDEEGLSLAPQEARGEVALAL